MMQVRLLGPVDVLVGGKPQEIAGLRRRAVLAVLALHGGEVVSTDVLLSAVWGHDAPRAASNTLQSHISGLRGALGARAAILARPPGYILDLGADGTDVQAAERLLREAEQSASPAQAAAHLRDALALWRGQPLADVSASVVWFRSHARRLEQLQLQAQTLLAESRLALGQHAQLIPELESLTRQHPLHEALWGQLMVALYRAGRQTDALAAFQRIRQLLLDEHGVDPGVRLQELHAAVLRHDPSLAMPAAGDRGRPTLSAAPVPAQLPLAVPSFTGRQAELAALDGLVPEDGSETGESAHAPPAPACLISGPAGVGKTALAVHWAHRAAARFPDGQLYVNLRGFDPAGAAVEPAEAVRGFLDAFAVPPEQIPAGLEAQVARYRSLVAGRRVLIVLDNASDVEQVRPLLPGTPGCLVIITSRHQLSGLIAVHDAHPLLLDVPAVAEARAMFTQRLGADRVAADPDAVAEIIDRCARLPLALAIVAARAATYAHFPLSSLADDLREAPENLDAFRTDDTSADVRAVLSWSYQKLDPDAARLFRLLGLHPGPDISVPAAASLADLPAQHTRRLLGDLTRVHLLTEHAPGRYAFHDLLRAYATELARADDDDQQRQAAVRRMLDHYLHTAHAAARLLKPERDPIDLIERSRGTIVTELPGADHAWSWLAAEHHVLLACIRESVVAGLDRHAWQLAWTIKTYLYRRGYWPEQMAAERIAADAAGRGGDLRGRASALFSLAEACVRLNRLDEADAHYRDTIEAYAAAGDLSGEADAWVGASELADLQHRYAESVEYSRRALDLFRRADDATGEALALNSMGWSHALAGEYRQALRPCRDALVLLQGTGSREGEAGTWNTLGRAYHGLGDYQQADVCYQRAIEMFAALGDHYNEGVTHADLGDAYHSAGDIAAARQSWGRALEMLGAMNDPAADDVRAKLNSA